MDKLNFSKEELAKIEEFLKAATRINEIYNKLYHLEINGKKDSEEYNKLLKMLKEAINIENNIYINDNLTLQKCIKMIELLASAPNSTKISNINCIIEQNDSDIIVRRVINILTNKTLTNKNYAQNLIPKEMFEQLKNLGIPIESKQAYKNLNNDTKVQVAINNDITIVFLSILEDTITFKKYETYRNKLLKAKYDTVFTLKDIEEQIIENKFTIPTTVYINSRFINDLLQSEPQVYNMIKSIEVQTKASMHIIRLLNITDEDYKIENNNIASIIRQCYIRSLLTFMNDDEVYDLNDKFHELVESQNYLETHPYDRISETAIINCFKSLKQDRTKTRILSFKP